MNCIVTAGPTYQPLDDVRRLTNFSTGRLGTELANFLAARGHQVTLLVGEQASYSGERRAQQVGPSPPPPICGSGCNRWPAGASKRFFTPLR